MEAALAAAMRIGCGADGLPPGAGAYGLLIRLARPTRLGIRTLGRPRLAAGLYLYLGSARGPGGIAARVRRHLRQDKPLHWHVDHLTRRARVVEILAVPGGSECRLADMARALPGVHVPVPGFGSSDCRRCPAHLLALNGDGGAVMTALATAVAATRRRV
jgi:Uri superfamily endonuclease